MDVWVFTMTVVMNLTFGEAVVTGTYEMDSEQECRSLRQEMIEHEPEYDLDREFTECRPKE